VFNNMNNPDPAHPVLKFPQSPRRSESRLEQLVRLEGEIRLLPHRAAIALHAVNQTREITACDQVFFFRLDRYGKCRMDAAGGVARIEPSAMLPRTLAKCVMSIGDRAQAQDVAIAVDDYPYRHGYWAPCVDAKFKAFAGLLFVRAKIWTDADAAVAARMAQAYGHAMRAMTPPSLLFKLSLPRWIWPACAAVAVALAFIPMPLTVLAPVEVVAKNPVVVTAPTDGVIAEIVAAPNAVVKAGDMLFRLDKTTRSSEAEVAAQRVLVAEAKVDALKNGAFGDINAGHDLPVAEKELELARLESEIAARLLASTDVRATQDGVASFASRDELTGKTVRAGERILEIANPAQVEYRATLAVHDAIALAPGARVRVFLDTDPLDVHAATIASQSFHAQADAEGQLGYRIIAEPHRGETARLGVRGVAQITGKPSTLGMALLRRPIAAIRQYVGW
jgi:hypothetical protein